MTDRSERARLRTVEEMYGYGSAFAEYEAFAEALDHSLAPRGPGLLFDLVAELGLAPGSVAVDVGPARPGTASSCRAGSGSPCTVNESASAWASFIRFCAACMPPCTAMMPGPWPTWR